MLDAAMMVMVLVTVALALAVDVVVLLGWLRPLAGSIAEHVRRRSP
jgi:hypothetical protein